MTLIKLQEMKMRTTGKASSSNKARSHMIKLQLQLSLPKHQGISDGPSN